MTILLWRRHGAGRDHGAALWCLGPGHELLIGPVPAPLPVRVRAALDQEGAQAVAVVGRVGDAQHRGRQGADKGQGHTSIAQLTWRYLDGAGSSLFVDGKGDLGRAPASGPPDGLALRPPLPPAARRWALAWVESSRSALGGPPERASVSNTSRHTPRSAQRTKRLYRVFLGPYWGGASAHRPPERSTCTMPEITRRSSTRGTPRVSRGSKGARRANCSSVSQNRSDMLKLLTRRSLNPLTTNPVPIYGSGA